MTREYYKYILILFLVFPSILIFAQTPNLAQDIEFNSDGTYVAITYTNGQISVWDTITNSLVWSTNSGNLPIIDWHPVLPQELAYSSREGDLIVVDVETANTLLTVVSDYWTDSLEYHPQGSSILITANEREIGPRQGSLIKIVDRTTAQDIMTFEQILLPVSNGQWHPNGQQVFAMNDGEIVVWDASSGNIIQTSSFSQQVDDGLDSYRIGLVSEFEISPIITNPNIAVLTGGELQIVSTSSFANQRSTLISDNRELEWSPNGSYIAVTVFIDRQIRILDSITMENIRTLNLAEPVDAIAWHPNNDTILYSIGNYTGNYPDTFQISGASIITNLSLINGSTNNPIQTIANNDFIYLDEINVGNSIIVRANTEPPTIPGVDFFGNFNQAPCTPGQACTQTSQIFVQERDTTSPYQVNMGSTVVGLYTLTVTPLTESDIQNTPVGATNENTQNISFRIEQSNDAGIFTLVNANVSSDIGIIANGDIIDTTQVGNAINIRADIPDAGARSVVFYLNGQEFRTDNNTPYALENEQNGSYAPWAYTSGTTYRLVAEVYDRNNGNGTLLATYAINFTVE